MRKLLSALVFILIGAVGFKYYAQHYEPTPPSTDNLLSDGGFEKGNETAFSEHWVSFGNAFRERVTPQSGNYSAKLYGEYTGSTNVSGVYQDVDAEPGLKYEASIFIRSNSDDIIHGENRAWVQLEFVDAKGKVLRRYSPVQKFGVTNAQDVYVHLSTGFVIAPEKTAKARFVHVFEQLDGKAHGSTYGDDAMLRLSP